MGREAGQAEQDLSYQELLAAAMEAGLSGNYALESHYRRLAAEIRTARDALAEYIAMAETEWSLWPSESRFVTPPTPREKLSGQHGLGFDVEGPSGTDQVPVNLALTRGEHVDVTPAGEQRGPQYPVTFNVYVNNRDDLQALEQSVMQIFRGV